MNNHTLRNTKGERENPFDDETTAAAPAAHTRYLSSPPAATLHGKTKVSCCGFLPNTSPPQDSCSHQVAFCNLRCNQRIGLRTHEQPHVAEHPFVTTSLRHHFSIRHHTPFVTTSIRHHFPSSLLPLSRHHFPVHESHHPAWMAF